MMKWGKKKSSLPTSPRPSLISSWLLKFKKNSSSSEAKPTKVKKKGKWNSLSTSSPQCASRRGGRFYGGDDDAFWRISFGEERVDGRKSRSELRSVWYDSDDELETLPTSCQSCGSSAVKVGKREEIWKFSDMVSDVRKTRELRRDAEILPDMDTCIRGKEAGFGTPRRGTKERKLRKANRRVLEEKWSELERESDEAEEKDILELEPLRTIGTTEKDERELTDSDLWKYHHVSSVKSRNSCLRTIEEDCVVAALNSEETDEVSAEELRSAWKKLKEMKIEELKSKSEKQRKSLYIGRELQRRAKKGSKVRAYSPRTASKVEICKIKALEDMKKAKLKMKKKAKERVVEKRTGLDSFAVVKCSLDPQQDFKDSMIEMIMEKRISQPEELEELLACYLTLNSDEYHDLIIKVFRQVWFDLNQACFGTELQNEHCCYE